MFVYGGVQICICLCLYVSMKILLISTQRILVLVQKYVQEIVFFISIFVRLVTYCHLRFEHFFWNFFEIADDNILYSHTNFEGSKPNII